MESLWWRKQQEGGEGLQEVHGGDGANIIIHYSLIFIMRQYIRVRSFFQLVRGKLDSSIKLTHTGDMCKLVALALFFKNWYC